MSLGPTPVVFEVGGAGGGVGAVPGDDVADPLGGHAGHEAVEGCVGAEEHGGVVAVEGGVFVVVACDVGEVLHADLQGGGGDAVAVSLSIHVHAFLGGGGGVGLAVMFSCPLGF